MPWTHIVIRLDQKSHSQHRLDSTRLVLSSCSISGLNGRCSQPNGLHMDTAILSNEISWRFHRTYQMNRNYNAISKSHYRSPLKLLRSNQNQRRFLNRALNTFLRNLFYPAFCFWGNPFACQTPLAAAQWNWVGRVAQKETVNWWMISPHEKTSNQKFSDSGSLAYMFDVGLSHPAPDGRLATPTLPIPLVSLSQNVQQISAVDSIVNIIRTHPTNRYRCWVVIDLWGCGVKHQ